MKVVIAGGSGFVGQALVRRLLDSNQVVVLSRNPERVEDGRGVRWDAKTVGPWAEELEDADAVVNLAGAGIAERRWSAERKRVLVDSRIDSTRTIVKAIQRRSSESPIRLLNASATGYYGNRGREVLDENAHPGEGFLADLAVRWENAAHEVGDAADLTIMRLGVVLGEGGMVERLRTPFRFYLGGRLGNGRQYMPWIDMVDLVSAIKFLLSGKPKPGPYNLVSPEQVTNREFTAAFAKSLDRPVSVPAPALALKLVAGELAEELLLASTRVEPVALKRAGFSFDYPTLASSLRRIHGAAD